ncbi:GatB/YqeY domain-containing protein [Pseudoblastomonas halimionae]|uniref:GatB/YqeY domain-containing protein n=1 Tax=Alteriqipengyuania halimionae TaxID=1926630 RepID=A0A6I4U069_9SPHN|nr:GatB/YqeY domain-containing protein [Alteriqipengyuania halimionae]MXP09268.1 GatB/YqeY domain-containing protein [Alteriqipengyuania halimionae]
MIRENLKAAQIEAMKNKDKARLGAIRMILAKVKDRDIELRTASEQPDDDVLVTEVLMKMAKQRRESIQMFNDGGREEKAAEEQAELDVIEDFLPKQMDEGEMNAAIAQVKADVGAESIKDMGKVMAELKARHAGQMDFGKASGLVKASFG